MSSDTSAASSSRTHPNGIPKQHKTTTRRKKGGLKILQMGANGSICASFRLGDSNTEAYMAKPRKKNKNATNNRSSPLTPMPTSQTILHGTTFSSPLDAVQPTSPVASPRQQPSSSFTGSSSFTSVTPSTYSFVEPTRRSLSSPVATVGEAFGSPISPLSSPSLHSSAPSSPFPFYLACFQPCPSPQITPAPASSFASSMILPPSRKTRRQSISVKELLN